MRDVIEDVERWIERGDKVALASVVGVRRSAPRPPGAKMAINDKGEISGMVSGGCVEGAVIEIADAIIKGDDPQLLTFGITDDMAFDVGLPCGGEIDVWIERFEPLRVQAQFATIAREGGRAALVTAVRGDHAGKRILVQLDGQTEGTFGTPELDAEARAHVDELIWTERSEMRGDLFVDVSAPPPRLVIFGAVEFAVHLSAYARIAGWRAYVVDPRARFATRERFPDAVDVVAGWPVAAFEKLGAIDPATYVTVLTHDAKLDDAVLLMALESQPAYIGAMGSKRAQKERRERLVSRGVTDEELTRISAPVGLDLGATGARETALSIMAECVAVRHGRDGGRLCQKGADRKRIHAEAAS